MKHQWGGSLIWPLLTANCQEEAKCIHGLLPSHLLEVAWCEFTQRLCFCTNICLDIRESLLGLSSNLPWPSGLAAPTALWDPSWESWLRKETPISELVLNARCLLWGRWPPPPRKGQSLGEGAQKSLQVKGGRTFSSPKQVNSSVTYLDKFWGFTKDSDLLLHLSEPLICLFIFSVEDLMFELGTKCLISI